MATCRCLHRREKPGRVYFIHSALWILSICTPTDNGAHVKMVNYTEGVLHSRVTLSVRNILSLLTKAYTEDSLCEIQSRRVTTRNEQGQEVNLHPILTFAVKVEKDEKHYADRPPTQVVPMHPITEVMIHFLEALQNEALMDVDYEGNKVFYISKEDYELIKKGM